MMNEYVALMYGVLIGYGICVIINKRLDHQYDWLVLIATYLFLLLLTSLIEI